MLGGWALAGNLPLAHPVPAHVVNTVALGRILYTDYIFYFQTAGLILLVAMIGAIVLTLRTREASSGNPSGGRSRASPRKPSSCMTSSRGRG